MKIMKAKIVWAAVYNCLFHNCLKPETTQMSFQRWLGKLWCIYKVEYYSVIKRSRLQIHTTVWMGLKDMTLSEGNQSQNVADCMIPFIEYLKMAKI